MHVGLCCPWSLCPGVHSYSPSAGSMCRVVPSARQGFEVSAPVSPGTGSPPKLPCPPTAQLASRGRGCLPGWCRAVLRGRPLRIWAGSAGPATPSGPSGPGPARPRPIPSPPHGAPRAGLTPRRSHSAPGDGPRRGAATGPPGCPFQAGPSGARRDPPRAPSPGAADPWNLPGTATARLLRHRARPPDSTHCWSRYPAHPRDPSPGQGTSEGTPFPPQAPGASTPGDPPAVPAGAKDAWSPPRRPWSPGPHPRSRAGLSLQRIPFPGLGAAGLPRAPRLSRP